MSHSFRRTSRRSEALHHAGRSHGPSSSRLVSSSIALALCAIAYGCASASGAGGSGGRAPAVARSDSTRARVRFVVSDPYSPDVGPAAVKAFVPDIVASDSGGECAMRKLPGMSSANIATASFPNRAAALMTVSLTFDSVGHLVQYSEMRGVIGLRGLPPGTSMAQRDSMLKAARAAMRSTSISFNYPIDQGVLRNYGGGKPDNAVLASIRELESLPKLGPVKDRLVRVRKLCGV